MNQSSTQAAEERNDAFAALAERVAPGARLVDVSRMTGGVSAHVHAMEIELGDGERQRFVVRRHGAAQWKPGDVEVTEREFALLKALHAGRLPVPEPLLLDALGAVFGAPCFVMSYVEGTTEIADEAVDRCVETMADALAHLHDLPTGGLPALPALLDPQPEIYDYVPDTATWQPVRSLLDGMPTAWQGPSALLHGDFWPGNLLWRDGALVAILDWEDASLGDPLSDLAGCRIEMLWKYGRGARDRFTARYAGIRDVDPWRLALWDLFVGLAAMHFMANWGLEPEREAMMRARADDSAQVALATLLAAKRGGVPR
jgi:aminoglycoside phosphotransferase (APT) family kinase protein